jgi:hypothetical protein
VGCAYENTADLLLVGIAHSTLLEGILDG